MKIIYLIILLLISNISYAGSGSYLCTFEDGVYKNEQVNRYENKELYEECKQSNNEYFSRKYNECTKNIKCAKERTIHHIIFVILIVFMFILLISVIFSINNLKNKF